MSNFYFVKEEWPSIHADCTRAEGHLGSDPRSACFYARRAAEQLVGLIYDVDGLTTPYRDDLAARVNEPAFQRRVGVGIGQKLNLIRKLGNRAVHDTQPIPARAAVDVLRELHHVVVWTAFRYSTNPAAVPTGAVFDPKLAGSQAPLSRADVVKLAEKFHQQDEAHARALKERDEVAAAKDAEIEELRQQIKAVQAANTLTDTHDYSEAQTRDLIIDELLREAGWQLTATRDREFEVTGMPNAEGKGYVDYVLWGSDGLPLAVVEAKKTTVEPAVGQQQAKLYADSLKKMTGRRPVIFYTNGYQTWLWDDAAGYPPRRVEGFFAADELELMVHRRTGRLPLADASIDKTIVGRHYQQRAIRTVGETFAAKQRAALLVMATGSGKTRTVIALVDQLMKAGWVKRVLFLADRTALVNQAVGAFKAHLPNATTVNLVTEKVADGRVYVSTYPTMMNLINETDGGLRLFGPGYFDLIVIDEAHRSVYQKYRAIFSWFGSLLVGLTATPKDEVDRNTYTLFNLEDGVPTDAYSLDEAVAEGYLVPPVAVSVPTKFLREGIRYNELSEQEKDDWDSIEWSEDGDVPDAVTAEELNKFLFNADTVDKVLATLMQNGHKVAGGDRLGKTIIFAKNQAHAEFIQKRFDANYPEYAGHFARVITHSVTYAQSLIDDFSSKEKAPHIAISVDMLDTGIDVPEVVNLVFFKLVRAKSKFWQMIGRGTRLCPDLYGPGEDKKNFYVFDFCGNLEFFSQDLPDSGGSLQKSLAERLFEARLGLLAALDQTGAGADSGGQTEVGQGEVSERGLRVDAAWTLHEVVVGMNVDNFLVRPARQWVETYSNWDAWHQLTPEKAGDIAHHLAGLPSTKRDDDEDAKRFDLILLRLQLAQLDGDAIQFERLRTQVQDIAAALLGQTAIPSVKAQEQLLEELSGDEWWVDVTLPMLELARRRIRGLVRFVEKSRRAVVYSNFADELGESSIVELPGVTPGTNWERFRAKARAYLRDHDDHLALQRLRRNLQLTPEDLASLEAMLVTSGAGSEADIARAREESHGLGLFIRSLVGLDREAATAAFDRYLSDGAYSANQIRFVQLIVEHLTANGAMEVERLYESPFIDSAPHGPDSIFTEDEVDGIVTVLHQVRDRALPDATVA
ncbi:Type III restriction enzyme, restriction (R) subunit [Modestobacter italicus]|uniref:Type III restriction enzyme, restriction (R) subunit n=1 Tax=Modestobacter italicus (strain DSM 44449 / CECT 9708 / BC 501) TaxID=2732864 RepID=I4F1L7_MODI5|nr:DEAD/DEAH box helicase family protein [Modestobacter marinus]CCH89530.1 Type III restriction enzyme, restriction (R) subunit [Modestobacter marinus]